MLTSIVPGDYVAHSMPVHVPYYMQPTGCTLTKTVLLCMSCIQGQHVRHLAKRAVSPHGRITMVTGYIPADPLLSDQTVLRVSKMMSDLPTLFHQWAQYRLERFGKQAQLISQVIPSSLSGCLSFID